MSTPPPDVQIPSKAVSEKTDVRQPTRDLLEDLNLLGTATEDQAAAGFAATFSGPPQSVALIEAGATAAAKWWAAGLGAAVIPLWASVANWWPNQKGSVQVVVIGGALFVTAALVVAIGYLIASDVRGRAAASVSLIDARAKVATEMLRAARALYEPTPAAPLVETIALPKGVRVKNLSKGAADEENWLAVAMERHPGENRYIVVKGLSEETVAASGLDFG
jgi:hypothetical protein